MHEKVKERLRSILKGHQPSALSRKALKEISIVLSKVDKELGGK